MQSKDFIMEVNLAGKFRVGEGGTLCEYKDPEVKSMRYCSKFRQNPVRKGFIYIENCANLFL